MLTRILDYGTILNSHFHSDIPSFTSYSNKSFATLLFNYNFWFTFFIIFTHRDIWSWNLPKLRINIGIIKTVEFWTVVLTTGDAI